MTIATDSPPAGLQLRPAQQAMLEALRPVVEGGGALAVEAPTGVGKTYAYLIAALESGERFVVSTATRALQDQLVDKDLPTVLRHLGLARRVAMLKGRENYLCLHFLAQQRQTGSGATANDRALAADLAVVERWAQSTPDGDWSRLPGLAQPERLRPLVTATQAQCLGSACRHAERCFANRARTRAAAAEVLVINHHLYFSDLKLRHIDAESPGLVPLAPLVVFDEAHRLQPIGLAVLAQGFSVADVAQFVARSQRLGQRHARGWAPWDALQTAVQRALERWTQAAGTDSEARAELVQLHNALSALVAALQSVAESAADLNAQAQAGLPLLQALREWARPGAPGLVRWWEAGGADRAGPRASPLWLWQALQRLAPRARAASWMPADGAGDVKTWIFTSATLAADAAQDGWVEAPAAIPQLRLPSPFDWAGQAGLVVPELQREPLDAGARAQVLAAWLAPAVRLLGGRCLVLCTSLQAMQLIGAALRQLLAGEVAVMVQGEQPKPWQLAQMRSAKRAHALVGTMGLWEGVDLPGDSLQLLVIDKLPFPAPHEVLHAARAAAVEAAGGDGFNGYTVPYTATLLRQGVGRLIRSAGDRGVVVIADERLLNRPYGSAMLAALPPMRRLGGEDWMEAVARLVQLRKE
ncbi:MAG: ATP-dependent DNA helicase [Comamonas sp.]